MIDAIDVSHYQEQISFQTLYSAYPEISIWSKATQAYTYIDPTFAYNFLHSEWRYTNTVRGAYHFLEHDPKLSETESGVSQARFYLDTVLGSGYNLALDYTQVDCEEPTTPGLVMATSGVVGAFTKYLQDNGVDEDRIHIYTRVNLFQPILANNPYFTRFGLWLAGPRTTTTYLGNTEWPVSIYQSGGVVPGISKTVDVNEFINFNKSLKEKAEMITCVKGDKTDDVWVLNGGRRTHSVPGNLFFNGFDQVCEMFPFQNLDGTWTHFPYKVLPQDVVDAIPLDEAVLSDGDLNKIVQGVVNELEKRLAS